MENQTEPDVTFDGTLTFGPSDDLAHTVDPSGN